MITIQDIKKMGYKAYTRTSSCFNNTEKECNADYTTALFSLVCSAINHGNCNISVYKNYHEGSVRIVLDDLTKEYRGVTVSYYLKRDMIEAEIMEEIFLSGIKMKKINQK